MADPDVKRIQPVLDRYKDFNFVKRIAEPDKYPFISNKDGTRSTHMMAWGEYEGKHVVYPTIVQYPNGSLSNLGPDRGFTHAIQTGEYIPFDSAAEADWFSQNYKKIWDK
tara:strand:+ start:422 stop:751 length:330 start_codon:yes stop_codon:yes gene_type:complete